MKIIKVETLHYSKKRRITKNEIPCLWVRLETDFGLIGLGETYPVPEVEESVIHALLAPVLLGAHPFNINQLWSDMFRAVSLCGWAGAEMRAISAVDIALWDLLGKATGLPVYHLLGGRTRSALRIYNTCYDPVDFLTEPVRLARELFDAGIHTMKIWPFDAIARENAETPGHTARVRRGAEFITPEQLERGSSPLRQIKEAFGDSMAVAMEFHGCWNLPAAIQIARAIEPWRPLWLEEMLPQDNLPAYKQIASATMTPLTLSERLMSQYGFRELFGSSIAQTIMLDLSWCGGFSAARKIAAEAETFYMPVSPHNCGGPVLHFASTHLAAHLTNFSILETVRGYYRDRYPRLVAKNLVPENGLLPVPDDAGLGVELSEDLLQDPDLERKCTGHSEEC